MNKCCLKHFVPFDQVKFGSATYTRINTVFYLGYHHAKHKMTICSKHFFGEIGPIALLVTPMTPRHSSRLTVTGIHACNLFETP